MIPVPVVLVVVGIVAVGYAAAAMPEEKWRNFRRKFFSF